MRRSLLQLKILVALDEVIIPTVADIADRVGAKRPSVSRSLKLLKSEGLVKRRRDGWILTKAGKKESTMLNTRVIKDLEDATQKTSRTFAEMQALMSKTDWRIPFGEISRAMANIERASLTSVIGDLSKAIDRSAVHDLANALNTGPAIRDITQSISTRLALKSLSDSFGGISRSQLLPNALQDLSSVLETQKLNQTLIEHALQVTGTSHFADDLLITINRGIASILENTRDAYGVVEFQTNLLDTSLFAGVSTSITGVLQSHQQLMRDFASSAMQGPNVLCDDDVWIEATVPTISVEAYTGAVSQRMGVSAEGGADKRYLAKIDAQVDVRLSSLGTEFVQMRHGGWQAIQGNNPDRVRHAAASHREIISQALRRLVPEEPPEDGEPGSKLKWRARRAVSGSKSAGEFAGALAMALYGLYTYLNKPTHTNEQNDLAVAAALLAGDGLLLFLLAHGETAADN